MTRALVSLVLVSAVALAGEPPCTPTPLTASVQVQFKKGTSKVKDVAAWYRKHTCRDLEAPLSAAEAPLSLTLEGTIPAPRAADVVRVAASSAGYQAFDGPRGLGLARLIEPCDPAKARAVLGTLASPSCALDLDVFGRGECLDLRVTLLPLQDGPAGFEVSQLKAGSVLHALGLREGDVLAGDRSALLNRLAEPHFELQVTRGAAKKTLRCEVTGETLRLHPLNLIKEALLPGAALLNPDQCSIDPARITTRGDTVEIDTTRISEFDGACLLRSSRIVPSFENGKTRGLRVFAIRANTVLSQLGLQNGDTVRSINGRELDRPERALEVYSVLRKEKRFTVQLERRGEPKTLTVVLE